MLIRIELPCDRDYCGRLWVLDDAGGIAFGPAWCAGLANEAAAVRRGNDSRSCLLPYGDTPLGQYRLRRIISMRGVNDRALQQFGRFGIVSLGATGGQALMADSVGRFEIWIHGGCSAPDGRLANANGSVRLADPDILGLLNVLKGHEGAFCEIVEAARRTEAPRVRSDEFFDEGDPPSLDGDETQPDWPTPIAMTSPLRTIFLGEYDGGAADAPDTGDRAPNNVGEAAQAGERKTDVGDAGNAGQDKIDEVAKAGAAKEPIPPDDLGAYDIRAEAQSPPPERNSGWRSVIAGVLRRFFRDTTFSYGVRKADDTTPVNRADVEGALVAKFDAASKRKFADLPDAVRNALIDLAEAYGADLDAALPSFWSAATQARWPAAVQALLKTRDQRIIVRTRAADRVQGAIVRGALS
jgi:hypothetical protein